MAKRALLTGITGQDGAYLSQFLLSRGYEVFGVIRRSSHRGVEDHRLRWLGVADKVTLLDGDMGDLSSLVRIVKETAPHEIYNLAAQSFVASSWRQPIHTAHITATGVTNMLEAMRAEAPEARFYQASSSELFGAARERPQRETTPFHPRSPYAVAKAYAYWATVNFREAYGMFAVNGVLFNHESPRRGENFVTRKITMAVAEIAAGRRSHVSLGNLDSYRDWGFAGDYVEAMWVMLAADEPDDFVIGTGETHTVREFATLAFAEVGVTIAWEGSGEAEVGRDAKSGVVRVKVDPAYVRPAEVDYLLADPTKAREKLGWSPKVGFRELVTMMVKADVDALR